MQYFFLEYTNGVTDRTNNIYVTELGILQSLNDEVKQYNPLYRTLKSIMETHPLNGTEYHIVLSDAPSHALGPCTYNAPTSIEIRGVVFGTPCVDSPKRVTVRSHDETPPNHLRFVSSKEDLYDALYYTLLQMKAGKWWRVGLHTHQLVGDAWLQNHNKVISAIDFCRYQAHVCDPLWIGNVSTFEIQKDVLFHGGLLTHQYFVDQYIKAEEKKLDFLLFNQTKLKSAL